MWSLLEHQGIVSEEFCCAEDDGPATMDAIMLMLLHSLGGAWRASTGAILKKKFASGILTSDLFRDILTGHQVIACQQERTIPLYQWLQHFGLRCLGHR